MSDAITFDLDQIRQRVCVIAAEQLGLKLSKVTPDSRIVQDLNADSLDLIELVMEIEDEFHVALPNDAGHPSYKAVFTRSPFRLRDLAEAVYLQLGTGAPERVRGWFGTKPVYRTTDAPPFTQLGGILRPDEVSSGRLFEHLHDGSFRRRTDGMRCIRIPGAVVNIGSNDPDSCTDERPAHTVEIDSFLIDSEPVTTTAYARFLNSIGHVEKDTLCDWFVLAADDRRTAHVPIRHDSDRWSPHRGTETWPMMLVSWYGANAYSLWANLHDWRDYRSDGAADCFLPSEVQWEYAARGPSGGRYPWGDEPPKGRAAVAHHQRGATYELSTLPLLGAHLPVAVSPFGLNHMAGNVWQWCRDSYDPDFYGSPAARIRNAVNRAETGVKAERGGSWVGAAQLARSSYRRGRVPYARGRCLGFRCINPGG